MIRPFAFGKTRKLDSEPPPVDLDATQLVCETEPQCACYGGPFDGLEPYSCECKAKDRNAHSSTCAQCGAPMARINTDTGEKVQDAR
jgi:hypothetical protein